MSPKNYRPAANGAADENAPSEGLSGAIVPADGPYQLLPSLTGDEYGALKADIAEHGIRVPIDVDGQGRILDGHHRAAIAAGIDCPTRVITGLTEQQKQEHALAVNVQRRILTREQRRSLIAAELQRDSSRSDREVGRLLGVDHKRVASVRRELAGEIPHPRLARVLEHPDYAPFTVHPFLALVPLSSAVIGWVDGDEEGVTPEQIATAHVEEFARLAYSIRKHGLAVPIVVNHDRTVLVDGRRRYLACRTVHVEPRFTVLDPDYQRTIRRDRLPRPVQQPARMPFPISALDQTQPSRLRSRSTTTHH